MIYDKVSELIEEGERMCITHIGKGFIAEMGFQLGHSIKGDVHSTVPDAITSLNMEILETIDPS